MTQNLDQARMQWDRTCIRPEYSGTETGPGQDAVGQNLERFCLNYNTKISSEKIIIYVN